MKQPNSQPAATTPPKLALFTNQPKLPDTPGFPTPPIQTPATVPFQWEEVPGKPIKSLTPTYIDNDHYKPKHVRSLELPPRMIITSCCTPSPTLTTVMNNQCDRTLSSTWSFRKLNTGKSGSGIKKMVIENCKINSKKMSSSSRRWGGGSAKVSKEEEGHVNGFNSYCDQFNEVADICGTIDEAMNIKVLKKVKRKGSFFSTRSHFWARVQESVHEGLKQVAVPWRRSSRAGQHWK